MPRFHSPRVAAVLFGAAALVLSTAGSARADEKADVKAAVQKLVDAKSYTYTTTTEGGQGGQGGTATGKVEKDGYTSMDVTGRNNNTVKIVKKGEKFVADTGDGWQTAADLRAGGGGGGQGGGGRMIAGLARAKTPAEQAEQVLTDVTEVKKGDGGTYTADLPEAAAKKMMTPGGGGGRRGGGGGAAAGGNAPTVANAKVSVTFTLADGAVSKMAVHMTGTVTYNGNDRDIDRTTTTEIKDVDKTTADVPAEAKAKLEGGPTTKP